MEFRYQTSQSYPYFPLSARPIFDKDSRSIPFFVSTTVLAIQLLHACIKAFKNRATRREKMSIQERIRYVGGKTIFTFMVTRLVGCVALLGLSLYTIRGCEINLGDIEGAFKDCPELFLTLTFAYSTLLSLVSLFSTTYGTWSTRYNIVILLSALGVYVYRDIWPLATYTQRPADTQEGALLPIKMIILAWTSLGVPLFIPRRYVPVDPDNAVPNIEQTASFFSMMTYTYLDHTILLGYKVPHLSVDQLDPLSDRDAAAYRTQKAAGKEYVILALTILGYSMGGFAAPIGINRVLYYMETRGAGATIRPWFWTLWLFTGPMIQSFSFQWYIFIATRTLVRAEGLITQLVFEHSLRIRLKAETSKVEATPAATPADSAAVTPDNASAVTDAASEHSENTEHAAAPSQGSTVVSREPSSASTLTPSKSSSPAKGKADSKTSAPAKSEEPASDTNLVGKINNLVTTDLNNVTNARDFLMIIFYIPVQITFCMLFLYQVLGWSSLVGVAAMIVLLPFPGYIAKMLQTAQRQRMKKTDARVQAVTETVNILRMIKLFGWEQKMSERLDKTRQEELRWLWKLKLLDQVNGLFGFLYPIMTMMVSYTLYTVVMKETLTPSKIFSSMTVFNMLREQFYRLLRQSMDIIQGKVSLERIEEFLHTTELLDAYLEKPSTDASAAPADETATTPPSTEIGFRNATFTWSLGAENDGTITPSRREFKLRIKDELIFKKHGINLIIGPTGSGKTSILMALLGEMHFVPSNPDSWFNLPREGGIAYAAQESWVQNETIRNNILFRTPYDEVRYKKVIKQCALERDLELFEAGDATEVGERGLTLSGGQKARVTLARAIYSHAEILLLDDIFAALDVHTSSHIIDNCFKGDLIKGRTILLVTHNIALASPVADFIVSVGTDGRVKSQGKELSVALKQNPALKQDAEFDQEATEIGQAELDLPPKKPAGKDGKLVIAEEIAQGHVTWKSFMLLIRNLGGDHPVIFFSGVLLLLIIVEWGLTFQSWFLGYWGAQYEGHDPSEIKDSYYIGTYAALALSVFLLNFAAYMLYVFGSMRASRNINKLLIDSVLGSTLRWLDETPTARIITRCTQDIRAVDSTLPQNFMWLVDLFNGFLTKLGAVVLFTPIFLFPGVGIGMVGFFLGNMYLKAQLSVKRETSNARSPMLAHFSAAIHGIVSIRAYGAQDTFRQESLSRIDHYTRVARMSYNLNRWIGVRMDFLGAAFTSGLAMYLIYGPSIGASNTGFSLAMASDVAHFILIIVRLGNEFEVNANSLERIQSYLDIEHEPKATESGKPPASWPTSGDLRVENLSARYSQNGPKVLNDVSFHIQSGERVGIVGRTGSGKSSLTLSLLRCILTEGTVYYDGVATNTINLDALRSNITIIPQTPELISGTLRQNLDPFEQNDDAVLNDALQSAGLFSLQDESDEGRLSLDSVISGGGANLSVGQRQIIALARAMVRGSKLLILDEDYKTDSIIQNTLRTELGGDVTVITVAHRLQTIMDSDKIMVLDGGRLVEFGTPIELLQHKDGLLRSLVDGSGDKETLYALAGAQDLA
ncbi:multidrug resistance-associated ABC transporter [Agrocybe pediades]|nr:multidrug resistance-associated ABC transporter [Agrocybe pediades]